MKNARRRIVDRVKMELGLLRNSARNVPRPTSADPTTRAKIARTLRYYRRFFRSQADRG